MSRAHEPAAQFVRHKDERSFPSVVVRLGGQGSLRPPPPSSRARPRTPTWPGLGAAPTPETAQAQADFDEVDELIALSEQDGAFFYPPDGAT